MKNDMVLRREGMQLLRNHLGLVEAERFIRLMLEEPFNYTEWQHGLWNDKAVDDIFDAAAKAEQSHPKA